MKKMLVTGGTVFVSKYLAEYFAKKSFLSLCFEQEHPPPT